MINFKIFNIISADVSHSWQFGFQDPATPVMEGIINFHNDLMFFIVMLAIFVTFLLGRCIFLFNEKKNKVPSKFIHGTLIEIVWTVTPALILIIIAIPSFSLLYSVEEIIEPTFTLKVIGHQWYWSYEIQILKSDNSASDLENISINFDSYMIPDTDLKLGLLRLLEVDNRLILPTCTHIRVLITSTDVLHSWAIPSFGIKLDACPGRLNQTSLYIKREGVFYGQCSEICGINHGFMPIVVDTFESSNITKTFKFWKFLYNEHFI